MIDRMKKVCVVTGTRAEYGQLKPIIEKIRNDDFLEIFLVVTGMHLSPEFGLTYQEIEKDGFRIDAKNEILLSSDTPNGIAKSMGLGILGFADIFANNKIDLLVLLGDRYEIFSAASAAMVYRIPIAHIHGGELTEGAIDEAVRHSITKMSTIHFTATETYRNRVIQLGEQPDNVYNVGALGVENIKEMKLLNQKELESDLHFEFDKNVAMVTFHPVTLEKNTAGEQFQNILDAIESIPDLKIIFTKANSDTDGRIINEMIDRYVEKHKESSAAYTSLGQLRYLSTLQFCKIVVGNSSSGIIEAPSFGIPTVNIGDRQRGRVQSESVINCTNSKKEIERSINEALLMKKNEIHNPYEGENTSDRIIYYIKKYLKENRDIKKTFYDM